MSRWKARYASAPHPTDRLVRGGRLERAGASNHAQDSGSATQESATWSSTPAEAERFSDSSVCDARRSVACKREPAAASTSADRM